MRTIEEITASSGMSAVRTEMHAKTDLAFFLRHVVGAKLSPFHYEMLSILWKGGKLNRFVRIMAPRGHLKTTLFSVYFVTWRLYRESRFEISITSSTIEQAKRILVKIKELLDDNEMLKAIMPTTTEGIYSTWNKFQIDTANGNKVFISPFNSTARGAHVDLYIFDDILRDNASITNEQAKMLFWGTLYPCSQTRKGQMVVVGTPITNDDILSDISAIDDDGKRKHPDWICAKYAAVELDVEGNIIKALWPENFTTDEMERMRRDQGPLMFAREYLCNPMGGGSTLFPEDVMRRQTKSVEHGERVGNGTYYLGVDIALSKKQSSDFTVFTVIEKDSTGKYWMRKMERYKTDDQHWILERVKTLHRAFGFRKALIEDRGLSQGLVVDAINDEELRFVADRFVTTQNNKEEAVSLVLTGLQRGDLFILNNQILWDEMMSFGIKKNPRTGTQTFEALSGHDDCVMSLCFAFYAAAAMPMGIAGAMVV